MRNKIIIAGLLVMTFILADNTYATARDIDGYEQNSLGFLTRTSTEIGTGVQTQQQTQQKLQDGTGKGNQVQNQVKNQGEDGQFQNSQKQGMENTNGIETAAQRRSQVANAVQEMLQMSDRNEGVGQQVKIIAQAQNQNQEKLEASLQKVQSRGGFVNFFIGANYREINNAKKLLELNSEQIKQLNQIKNQVANQGDAQTLIQQTLVLEQANLQIENSLQNAQKGFSLFGWMFRMFSN